MALGVPIMDTSRARRDLGWSPSKSGVEALTELMTAMREGAGATLPPLEPHAAGPARIREFTTRVGGRV
jgi:hypothetical protein